MGKKVRIQLAPGDRDRLEALIANGNTPQKHVRRAQIVLLAGDGMGPTVIQRRLRVSRPTVRRWRTRYVEAGVDGLCHDKTRPPGKPPLGAAVVSRVIAKTKTETPPDATHWSLRTMAKAVGIAPSSVHAIWKAHGLKPHLVATFKLSNDPRFAEKLEDVVGLYLNPPEHAIVLSVDEKSQIQALDRTQPGLPMKKGRAGTMTHDYKRHGTTTLFAALDVLDGRVIGQCMQKHRHQEFIRFLNKINRDVAPNLDVHLIADNYATHKHSKVKAWLDRLSRFHHQKGQPWETSVGIATLAIPLNGQPPTALFEHDRSPLVVCRGLAARRRAWSRGTLSGVLVAGRRCRSFSGSRGRGAGSWPDCAWSGRRRARAP